jgi:hypothetical protein
MGTLALGADERVAHVEITEDILSVALADGRTICVPIAWYPRLLNATTAQRQNWQIAGAVTASIGPILTKTSTPRACSAALQRPAGRSISQIERSRRLT